MSSTEPTTIDDEQPRVRPEIEMDLTEKDIESTSESSAANNKAAVPETWRDDRTQVIPTNNLPLVFLGLMLMTL